MSYFWWLCSTSSTATGFPGAKEFFNRVPIYFNAIGTLHGGHPLRACPRGAKKLYTV